MSLSDYMNPKHDWSDRWHPIVVLEMRPVWKRFRWLFGLGYPASLLAAWWLLIYAPASPLPQRGIPIHPAWYYGMFALISLVVPAHVSGQIQNGFQQETFEDLLLTSLTREQLITGYVHWGCVQLVLFSGLALPFILLDCCLQRVPFTHALLVITGCWIGGGANCVIGVCLGLHGRLIIPWWLQFVAAWPAFLSLLTLGVPAVLLLLLVPSSLPMRPDAPLRRLFDPATDSTWPFWVLLIPWTAALYYACRYVTRWTARLMNRYPAK